MMAIKVYSAFPKAPALQDTHLGRGFYSSAEMQLAYSTAPAYWATGFGKLRYILPGSIILSDRHLSYPMACRNLYFTHYVVNHTEGFLNDDGYITNQTENLWRLIK